jgi:asparagine synthase (glutamine-hydrolysing)
MRFDGGPVDERLVRSMRDTMEHRGPDDAGILVAGPVGLAHRRLSIVDLTRAGHQPMRNEDGTLWLVFNGEIYNYVELAAELRQAGHEFSSHTDSETILHLYEEHGERCVERLNGMFAFAIWDSRRGSLFVARDRLGIKPLCYYIDQRRFVCASEAKAILADGAVPRAADGRALADYMFAGFPLGDRTAFEGIRQLPAGHTMTVRQDGTTTLRKYWDVEFRYDRRRSDEDTIAEVAALLDDAVRIHCRSDAPLGCHLSGGLDSSTVTSLAARHYEPLKTFSIRFGEGGYYDETEYARAVAQHAGAEYLETVPDASDFAALLPMLLWHMEMPLPNAGGFSYYTVSSLAAEHVKVSLTGHGGDEVFAGYPAQFRAAFGSSEGFAPAGAAPAPGPAHAWPVRLRRVLRSEGLAGIAQRMGRRLNRQPRSLEEQWVALHCGPEPRENVLLAGAWRRGLGGYSPVADYLDMFRNAATDEVLDRCLYHDLRTYLPGLLHMEDRVSMAVSLESRVPLLDYRIVDLLATVPPEQKVRGRVPKRLLRESASPLLPPKVTNRADKRGFPVPLDEWFSSQLRGFTEEIMLDPRSLDRGVFDPGMLRRREWTASEAWTLVNVELWYRIFIDRDAKWLERTRDGRLATTAAA